MFAAFTVMVAVAAAVKSARCGAIAAADEASAKQQLRAKATRMRKIWRPMVWEVYKG